MAGKSRFGFLLLLLVCGCFQRILPIRAIETKDGIAFELPEIEEGLSSKLKYELLDLTVAQRGCSSDCTLWDIARAPGQGTAYLSRARITYGEPVPATVVRTSARNLTPGIYTVAATVQEYGARAELVRSLSTLGDFEVFRDGSEKLRTRSYERSAKKGGCQ